MTEESKESYPILLVEDDFASSRIVEKTLMREGYTVETAENGIEALKILQERFFPIIITDLMMPRMDGLKLCQSVREMDLPGYSYIIILTALNSNEDIIKGINAGADEYLSKPLNHAELMARLKTGWRILDLEKSLKNAYEKIQILSITDPLTKSYNRGYVSSHLTEEVARAYRYKHPLSVVMCDIDHFKRTNDALGHQAGDEVLKGFVACLKGMVRDNIDWIARFGGEEFLIVLPETDVAGATIMARRICKAVADMLVRFEDKELKITASFGIAGFDEAPEGGVSVDRIIGAADKCLYQAKDEGRNRVVAGPPLKGDKS